MQQRTIKLNNHTWEVTLRDDADESIANEIFKFREYRIVEPFLTNLKNPVLDIGAHSGLFSFYVRSFNETVPIFAFEPEPENYKLLVKQCRENSLEGVTLLEKAIAAQSGKRKLVLTPDNLNHFLSPNEKLFSAKETIPVEALSLADSFTEFKIPKAGLVKMDIEGGEYEIIDALTDEVYTTIEAFLMEYHNSPGFEHKTLENKLREHGFSVQIFPSHFDKSMGFIFARNKRM